LANLFVKTGTVVAKTGTADSRPKTEPAAGSLAAMEERIGKTERFLNGISDSSIKSAALSELNSAKTALAAGNIDKAQGHISRAYEKRELALNIDIDRANVSYRGTLHLKEFKGFEELPRYGNWGGQGHSGGRDRRRLPINRMDMLFAGHDIAYGEAAKLAKNGSPLAAALVVRQADLDLVKGLRGLNRSDLSKQQLYKNIDEDWAYRNKAMHLFALKLKTSNVQIAAGLIKENVGLGVGLVKETLTKVPQKKTAGTTTLVKTSATGGTLEQPAFVFSDQFTLSSLTVSTIDTPLSSSTTAGSTPARLPSVKELEIEAGKKITQSGTSIANTIGGGILYSLPNNDSTVEVRKDGLATYKPGDTTKKMADLSVIVNNTTPSEVSTRTKRVFKELPDGSSVEVLKSYIDKSGTGFQATAYRLPNGQVVVAYAGTLDWTDRKTWPDIAFQLAQGPGEKLNTLNLQVQQARMFFDDTMKDFGKVSAVTGHSLGGALAQVVGAGNGVSTETFNAPGMATFIRAYDGKNEDYGPKGTGNIKTDNITNHVRKTDIIGHSGEHVGNVIEYSVNRAADHDRTVFAADLNAGMQGKVTIDKLLDTLPRVGNELGETITLEMVRLGQASRDNVDKFIKFIEKTLTKPLTLDEIQKTASAAQVAQAR
jgi:hypothetical protein